MHPLVNTAVKAARRAGNVITQNMDRLHRVRVEAKGRADFVSQVDHEAEAEIVDILLRAYPEHGIIGEEGSTKEGTEYDWIIDPLDGTTNFLHGLPHFCVSIAARGSEGIEHGVVFDPVRNELWTASRGQGTLLNDRRVRVSSLSRFDRAVAATGFSYGTRHRIDPWLASIRDVTMKTSGVRRGGSAALDLAYVASGRLDAFWEMELNLWDIAAGVLLVQEAGGIVSDLSGGGDFLESGDILATNAQLHDGYVEITKPLGASLT